MLPASVLKMSRDTSATAVPRPCSARELREDHQHVRLPPFQIHDTGIVMHGRDVPGLVRHAGGFRQAGRDAAAVLLLEHDLQHLVARLLRVGLAVGDEAQDFEQAVGGDLVVETALRRRADPRRRAARARRRYRARRAPAARVDADDVDEEVRGQVARLGDHPVGQLAHGERLAEVAVDVGIGVAAEVEHERLLVDDAREAVADVHRRIERQLAAVHLPEHAEQHGQLHRRRGVEVLIGVVRPLDRGLGVVERDAEVLERAPA